MLGLGRRNDCGGRWLGHSGRRRDHGWRRCGSSGARGDRRRRRDDGRLDSRRGRCGCRLDGRRRLVSRRRLDSRRGLTAYRCRGGRRWSSGCRSHRRWSHRLRGNHGRGCHRRGSCRWRRRSCRCRGCVHRRSGRPGGGCADGSDGLGRWLDDSGFRRDGCRCGWRGASRICSCGGRLCCSGFQGATLVEVDGSGLRGRHLLGSGLLRQLGLFRLLLTGQAVSLGAPAKPVGLLLDDGGGMAFRSDAHGVGEIHDLCVGHPELSGELVHPHVLRQDRYSPFVVLR